MKKFFAVTMAMVMAMSTTAFAAEAGEEKFTKGPVEITVEGKYEESHEADTVISVDVKWDAMNFVYSESSEGDWNPKTHDYDGKSTTPSWTKTSKNIELKNHSNTDVTASFTFNKTTEKNITGTFTKNTVNLDTAVGTTYANAPSASTAFSISGDALTASDTTAFELGKIVITLAEKSE